MRFPCGIDGCCIGRNKLPGLAEVLPGLAERLQLGHDRRARRQEAKASFRQAIRSDIPSTYEIGRQLFALCPNTIPKVFRQGDEQGGLF